MNRLIIIATALLPVLTTAAQPAPPPPASEGWCATSPARTEMLRERHEWREARETRRIHAAESPRVVEQDGVFIVEADDTMLINDDPLDLIGTTLQLRPAGHGYLLESTAIDYRNDVGDAVIDFGTTSDTYIRVSLPFDFPFHGTLHDSVYITNRNGIYFELPRTRDLNQYEAFDAAAIEQPVISPLLFSKVPRTFVSPALFVRDAQDEVVITWRSDSADFAYDVQAVISRDGSIRLSWRSAREVSWGAVVVTPGFGRAEVSRQTVVSVEDEIHDAATDRGDHDLAGLAIGRLEESDLLEVRIDLRDAADMGSIAPGEFIQYGIDTSADSSRRIVIHLTSDERWLLLPGRGWILEPGSLGFEQESIRFLVSDRDLESGDPVSLSVWVWDSERSRTVDSLYGSFPHDYSNDPFELDLSAHSGRTVGRPIVESFTLPDMDPYAVWDLVAATYGIDASIADALAIYQNFFTDLVLYAGAYSTVGNPGADGVSTRGGYGAQYPRSPSLLHMSKLGYRYNTTDELSTHVLNHEFGHRWLYFFEITENGESTNSLNPAGGHPAQYVHTPAAFDVRGTKNSSAMGGSWFDDRGDGTFRASEERAAYGYSWHELYLMGLASRDEVEPWFYIADSEPELGDAYYPPDGIVVAGTRRNVGIDQVIESMGARSPDHQRSRKRFTTYFVLLVRSLDDLSAGEVEDLHDRRRLLEEAIPLATGGRASVGTLFGIDSPRRRAVRRP